MKQLAAGSEIDAWCTKCRMDLGHRIVAMVDGRPKRVVCLTCGSQHNYRAPKSAETAVRKRAPATRAAGARPRTTTTKSETERVKHWEEKVLGQSVKGFVRYSMDRRYETGQLVLHKKFGEGYVVEVIGDHKVSIMFRDGARTLAQGQS